MLPDDPLRQTVEFGSGNARANGVSKNGKSLGYDFAGFAHKTDLFRPFENDRHASILPGGRAYGQLESIAQDRVVG